MSGDDDDAPTVRLACLGPPVQASGNQSLEPQGGDDGPTMRLAHRPGAQGDKVLGVANGPTRPAWDRADGLPPPALLVSYYYLSGFENRQSTYRYRDWALDSGAFSAHNSGKVIELEEYIAKCQQLAETDPTLVEIYALDVIGDWRASRINTERMWAAGIPAIPCFHMGTPWEELISLTSEYPKVAIGGLAVKGAARRREFLGQCFARIWREVGPSRLHGFGCAGDLLRQFPFHSGDASSWEMGPCAFGNWRVYGNMSIRGSNQNLRAEIDHYLRFERELRSRWGPQMRQIEKSTMERFPLMRNTGERTAGDDDPTIRLSQNDRNVRGARVLAEDPTIRLAIDPNAAGGRRAASGIGRKGEDE